MSEAKEKRPVRPRRPRGHVNPTPPEIAPPSPGVSAGERLGKSPNSLTGGRTRLTIELEGKMALLYRGDITVADMDNEELARLQFKAADGTFRGRPPNNLPQALVNMMRKELIDRVHEVRRGALQKANEVLVEILEDEDVKPADRIKAALALIERVEGKVPDKVELSTGDKPFEVQMARSVKIRRGGRDGDA